MRHTISVLVENEFGVLARVAGLFSGRGYNIDSLTVSETLEPQVSRMTIVTEGSDKIIVQILKQLNRLINVIQVEDLTAASIVDREVILVKVKQVVDHGKLFKIVELYGGRIVADEENTYILEFTGDSSALHKILEALAPFGILEFLSSGSIAMAKGETIMKEET
jgi:acetolactate synthase-1/3 small subunit